MRLTVLSWLVLIPLLAAPPAVADASSVWTSRCATCHGEDGRADTPAAKAMNAPTLMTPAIAGMGTRSLAQKIKGGETHKAPLSDLSDEDVRAVAELLKSMAAGS